MDGLWHVPKDDFITDGVPSLFGRRGTRPGWPKTGKDVEDEKFH
jgi:hypothetical protein